MPVTLSGRTFSWLPRVLRWSNSWQSWQERLALLALLLVSGLLVWFGSGLGLAQQLVLWSGLLLALAFVLRRGWVKLVGPVYFYDLICLSRRRRFFVLRTAYALLLIAILLMVFLSYVEGASQGTLPAKDMADFAATFFYWFFVAQTVAIFLLTPAYTAVTIADEKERRTLEFLLATDLRDREIVLSKLASRICGLVLLLLAGLPLLSFLQFLGGIDPNLVLAGYVASLGGLTSLAGVSILASVVSRKTRDAIAVTYLIGVAYLALSGMSWLLLIPGLGIASFPATIGWNSPVTVEDLVTLFNKGNPVAVVILIANQVESGTHLEDILPAALRDFILFHGLLALLTSTSAVLLLRRHATPDQNAPRAVRSRAPRVRRRRPVSDHPMLWKEIHAEPGVRLGLLGRIVGTVFMLAILAPAVWIIGYYLFEDSLGAANWWKDLGMAMNWWVRILGTLVICLMLLSIAVRSSTNISGERDRQTLDSLLTSPLESDGILFGKWVGNLCSIRWLALWLVGMWGVGLLTGGLHPLGLILVLLATLVFAAFCSSLGLFCSIVCNTSLRATITTLAALIGLSVGHWLVAGFCCYMPISLLFQNHEASGIEHVAEFQLFGLTPPYTLGFLAVQGWEFEDSNWFWNWNDLSRYGIMALLGLFLWAGGALAIYLAARRRFRIQAHRLPLVPNPIPAHHLPLVPNPIPALDSANSPRAS